MPLTDVAPEVKVRQSQTPLRLAVIGCGAVAQEVHLPVLAGHDGIRLQALVDRNQKAAASLAAAYKVPVVASDLGELDYTNVDAVLIATPPYHHAPCALEAIRHGLHVFVEKPMAVSLADAEAMVKAAREAGVVLVVGVFRRLFSSTRMMQALIASGQFGQPLRFDAEEGHIYDWSCASLGSMRKDLAGGGVLSDTGAHTLDQVLSFFTGPAELVSYHDNSHTGIESDCVLRLRVYHQGKPVEGRVELSRTRQLRNTFRVETERGTLEFATKERGRVSFQPHDLPLVDPAHGQMRTYENQWSWSSLPEACLGADIRAEFEDWLTAIQTGQTPVLSGESMLPTVRITEECYRNAQPLEEPWAKSALLSPATATDQVHSNGTPHVPATVRVAAPAGRMLVTGASGFIGGRLVELLESQPGLELRALVHNPGSASRLARLPVEMCLGDLRSREDLARVVAGCDTVVHCAYGSSGTDRESWATTVEGTRNLVKAAQQAGVKRFVHLSTIAVYGLRGTGTLDETTPPHPEAEPYSQAKTAAEEAVAQAAHEGLCTTILRLANVYGPFSMPYSVRPVQHLRDGLPVFVGRGETPSNTVFVDNVVEAILRVLASSETAVNGQTFIIADGDGLSWADFHRYYAEAMGVEMRGVAREELERLRQEQAAGGWLQRLLSWPRGIRTVLTSPETISLARKVLRTPPLGTAPRYLMESIPGLRRRLKHAFKLDRARVYRPSQTPHKLPPLGLLELYACPASVSTEKARRVLGYGPMVGREEAMQRTLAWLRYGRYL